MGSEPIKSRWIDSEAAAAHLAAMIHQGSSCRQAAAGQSAFGMACSLLGLMALAQLVVGGMALAVRLKESNQVQLVEKEIIREVRVEVPATGSAVAQMPANRRPAYVPPPLRPTPLSEPEVAEPRTSLLLTEAREARVAGDMVKAIVKLEQALKFSPGEASVLYELGVVHEQMGIYDKAAAYYEQVFRLGMTQAGSLYELAAAKLRDGFEQPADMIGKLSLGRVQIFKNPNHAGGEQVILTVPVQKSPTGQVEVSGIQVEVYFFNRTSHGEVVELEDPSWVETRWNNEEFDWSGGEESLRITYTIPPMDVPTEHLFGELSYYGQVVTLTYEGEVLDVQAWPRDLAARANRQPAAGFGELLAPEFQDSLPLDFDPTMPLLPALPE